MLHVLQASKHQSMILENMLLRHYADAKVCQDKIIFFFNHARLCHVTSGYDQHEAGHSELQSIAEQC